MSIMVVEADVKFLKTGFLTR